VYLPSSERNLTKVRFLSTLCLYRALSSGGLASYAVGERLMLASRSSPTATSRRPGARLVWARPIACQRSRKAPFANSSFDTGSSDTDDGHDTLINMGPNSAGTHMACDLRDKKKFDMRLGMNRSACSYLHEYTILSIQSSEGMCASTHERERDREGGGGGRGEGDRRVGLQMEGEGQQPC
jgi:hypothetical protein